MLVVLAYIFFNFHSIYSFMSFTEIQFRVYCKQTLFYSLDSVALYPSEDVAIICPEPDQSYVESPYVIIFIQAYARCLVLVFSLSLGHIFHCRLYA